MGAAESGCGAALLAQKWGKHVFVTDHGKIKDHYQEVLKGNGIDYEMGTHSIDRLMAADLVIKSPGIPDTLPIIQDLKNQQIEVVSEIEFASWFTDAKLICITGSNGKTTTTALTGYILQQAGLDVCVAGNIGQSFAWQLCQSDHDYFVLEISSFQLDGMFSFKADIAVLLNITPDHLDRYHHNFEEYAASKMRITRNQTVNDALIYNADDDAIRNAMAQQEIQAKKYAFSLHPMPDQEGAYIQDSKIVFNVNHNTNYMTLEQLALQGKHNSYNSMAAGISAKLLQIRKETIKQCMSDFQNIAHRLEYVANVHGVSYYNDSKATNVNATWYALESMDRPVVWIAGGVDKGNDYTQLLPLVREKVKALICLGKDNDKLIQAFGDVVEVISVADSASEAVFIASNIATNNDVVLLSPACASFDLFESYEDRGIQFKNAVKAL